MASGSEGIFGLWGPGRTGQRHKALALVAFQRSRWERHRGGGSSSPMAASAAARFFFFLSPPGRRLLNLHREEGVRNSSVRVKGSIGCSSSNLDFVRCGWSAALARRFPS